jgi:hypothetical protein
MQESNMRDNYKVIDLGKRGKRYMKNGHLIKKTDLSEEELAHFEHPTTEEELPKLDTHPIAVSAKSDRSCIFCGAYSKFTKLINSQTIYLCEQDYYDKNIGKITQKVNEVS